MGFFCPKRKKPIPTIICNYELNNKEQKRQIFELIKEFNYDKQLNFHLVPKKEFTIKLNYNSQNHIITTCFEPDKKSISKYIDRLNTILYPSSLSIGTHSTINSSASLVNINEIGGGNNVVIKVDDPFEEDDSKDDEKLKKIKNELFSKFIRFSNLGKNDIRKQELLNMSIYGKITEKQIGKGKQKVPKKFKEINEILGLENTDKELFALGLLGNILIKNNVKVAIIDQKYINEEKEQYNISCLHFITMGNFDKKKYDLIFESNIQQNRPFLNNKSEEEYENKLINELSKYYDIPNDKIIINLISLNRVQVILLNDEKNLDQTNISKLKNNNKFPELKKITDIKSSIIMTGCILSKNLLDSKGNKFNNDWGQNESRGGKLYIPPNGWLGIGLKVSGEYDKDNSWLGMNNSQKEWCVAYKWIGKYVKNEKNEKYFYSNKAHKDHDDQYHLNEKVGEGIFCTPNIKLAELFAETLEINGKYYKIILMVRVNNDSIRSCKDAKDYWVIDGTVNDIRPYRILYKQV